MCLCEKLSGSLMLEKVNGFLDEAERLAADDPVSLRHVRWERTIVDRTMYVKLAQLLKEGYVYDREKVLARFEANAIEILKNWSGWNNGKRKAIRESRITAVKQEASLYSRYPIPVPEIFNGLDVIPMEWNQIPLVLGKYRYVEDPLAAGGTAFTPTDKKMAIPYVFGMYNNQRKEGDNISLYREDIPQDGKYHCYRIGSAVIQQPLYVFFNGAWNPRTYMKTLGIIPETRDVWVSARFQGPVFVDGSTEEDGVFIDRMFLVKGSAMGLYENVSDVASPVNGVASGIVDGRSGLWKTESIGDPSALIGDMRICGTFSQNGVTADAFPFGGIYCLDAHGKKVFSIPVATFYLGNYDARRFETVIEAKRILNRLRRREGSFVSPCALHFAAYVPPESKSTVSFEDVSVEFVRKKKGNENP